MSNKEIDVELLRLAKEQFRILVSGRCDGESITMPQGKWDLWEALRRRSEELWKLKSELPKETEIPLTEIPF